MNAKQEVNYEQYVFYANLKSIVKTQQSTVNYSDLRLRAFLRKNKFKKVLIREAKHKYKPQMLKVEIIK